MKAKYKSKKNLLIFIAILLIGTLSSYTILDDDDDFYLTKNLTIFHDIVRDIRLVHVDDVSAGEVVKTSIDQMLAKLDPYTVYYPESKIEDYSFMSTGSYGGIGATIIERNGQLLITEIYENSPAHKVGLMAGDIILSIDGNAVKKEKANAIKENLKGEPESIVALKILQGSTKKTIYKEVKRAKVELKNVPFFGMTSQNTGYIKLAGFRPNASGEVRSAFKKLKSDSGMTKLVLDLRGNPGGLLIEAVRIVNLFVDKGNNVVNMRGKSSQWNKNFDATSAPLDTDIPIVVLVNGNSASASEIVSGALQDLDRAVIVGQRTFGKGLVQVTRDLSYNTKLKITTAKYYIPSGRCIQELDYTHRNADGTVGNIPDSLMQEFKTRNGRKVLDGGGILPDILVDNKKTDFVNQLYSELLLFDFVTLYQSDFKKVTDPKTFSITDKNYLKLEGFLNVNKFTYQTENQKQLSLLIEHLKKSGQYEAVKSHIIKVKAKLESHNKNLLLTNKKAIKSEINKEICRRYFFKTGEQISSFKVDKDLIEAEKILNDQKQYSKLLRLNI